MMVALLMAGLTRFLGEVTCPGTWSHGWAACRTSAPNFLASLSSVLDACMYVALVALMHSFRQLNDGARRSISGAGPLRLTKSLLDDLASASRAGSCLTLDGSDGTIVRLRKHVYFWTIFATVAFVAQAAFWGYHQTVNLLTAQWFRASVNFGAAIVLCAAMVVIPAWYIMCKLSCVLVTMVVSSTRQLVHACDVEDAAWETEVQAQILLLVTKTLPTLSREMGFGAAAVCFACWAEALQGFAGYLCGATWGNALDGQCSGPVGTQ